MPIRWTLVAAVSLTAMWIAVRTVVFAEWRLLEFPDSRSYLAKAGSRWSTFDYFVGTGRFFVVPLFYKLLFALQGPSRDVLARGQFLLALVAWIVFAWSLARQTGRGWFGVASLTAVLAPGLSTEVMQWDAMVLSESVSTSLFVLFVAAWTGLAVEVSSTRVGAVVAAAALWSMSREANSLLLPFAAVGAALLAGVVVRRRRLRPATALRWLTVGAMLIGWLPFAWFTWHVIGGMDVGRHEWSGVLMSRVGATLLLVSAADAVSRRLTSTGPQPR